MTTLATIIKDELVKDSSKLINIRYSCGTTFRNSEYIDVKINDTTYKRIDSSEPRGFEEDLAVAIAELNNEYPNLHFIKKNHELHFLYPGFNSCSSRNLPITISNADPATEVKKTGIVTESYSMTGSTKLRELFDKYPDYEVYCRTGFAYRGAREGQSTREEAMKTAQWAACIDIKVIDNEIHVNAFSANDMW